LLELRIIDSLVSNAQLLRDSEPIGLLEALRTLSEYSVVMMMMITIITIIVMKEVLYEVRCLKSTEDMILALAGQFKQLSHEPEKFR